MAGGLGEQLRETIRSGVECFVELHKRLSRAACTTWLNCTGT